MEKRVDGGHNSGEGKCEIVIYCTHKEKSGSFAIRM